MSRIPLSIDVVIPSIRMDMKDIPSMLSMDVPPNVSVRYYVISDNTGISSTSFTHNGCPVKIIVNEENLGASLSRNVGIDAGSGDYVLFLDDDVVPSSDILYSYLSAIEAEPDASGYSGPTAFPDPLNSFTRGIRASDMLVFFDHHRYREWVPWGTTSNLMISRKRIGNVRFLDVFPKHGGGEDIDFCMRISENHDKWFKSVPDACVRHNWWNNSQRSYVRFFRWGFGDSRLPKMYPSYTYKSPPNIIEATVFGIPILASLSVMDVFSFNALAIWIGCVVLGEFVAEQISVKKIHPKASLTDTFEATLIRLSNDMGKFTGNMLRRNLPGIFTRFDFFKTREYVSSWKRKAMIKFSIYAASIPVAYWLGTFVR